MSQPQPVGAQDISNSGAVFLAIKEQSSSLEDTDSDKESVDDWDVIEYRLDTQESKEFQEFDPEG